MLIFQMKDATASIQYDIEMMEMRPDPEPILVELIHDVSIEDLCAIVVVVVVAVLLRTDSFLN